MSHSRSFIANLIVSALIAVYCTAQTSGTPDQSGTDPQGRSNNGLSAAQYTTPEADSDSADIPPFARSRISQEEYLARRDRQIRMLRGIDDLVRDPLLRSKAIRTMELQQIFLRQLREGGAPLGLLAPAATNTWMPLGPAPIPNGQTDPIEVPVSGRVTAIAIDPTDPAANTVYVGAAQGGLYRTLDGGSTWIPLMDGAQTLAIGALALDPLDPTILFVGTGEGNNSGDSFFGVGLYIIRNAPTVTPILSGPFNLDGFGSDVFTGRAITQILVDPADHNKILVSSSSGVGGVSGERFSNLPARGVYLSTNAQSLAPTFTRLNVPTGNGNRTVSDMAIDPGNPAKVLVSVLGLGQAGDGGVWSSDTDPFTLVPPATWTQRLTLGGNTGVVAKFAANRVSTTTTFMLAASDSAACGASTKAGTLRSSHDGFNWAAIPGATGFCGGQCAYDEPVAIDPQNADVIYIGGQADSSGAAALSCGSAILAKSVDGINFNRSGVKLHPDSHAIAIAPQNSSIIYTGNDGGIFKSVNGGATWTSLNNSSFSATQFQSLALHPTDPNFMIGGTQDNGTEFLNPAGAWARADFGDGGYSLIDQSSVDTSNVAMYHTYFNFTGSNGLIGLAQVKLSSNATEGKWDFFGCPASPAEGITGNGITCTDDVLFYAPMALGAGLPNPVYFGTDRLYRSSDEGATMNVVSQAPFEVAVPGFNFAVSAIGVSPQNDKVRIVGLEDGSVFATATGANPIPNVTGSWGPHYVARAVVDPTNANTAYITLDGYGFLPHVWKTTNLNNATPTWLPASGSLPDVPVNAFVVDPLFPNSLYAGTDIGVFNSTDGGTTWTPYGTGLPRVAVFDMAINNVTRNLRIATHGRGIWEIATVKPPGAVALTASNISPTTGTSVTLTANVVQNGSGLTPTGTVTFNDGATALAPPVTLNASGAASLQTSFGTGTHNVTAAFITGDANYSNATSESVLLDVGSPDYALNLPKPSATITAGQSLSLGVWVAPQHGFSGTVSFSCSGMPGAATCSISPGSVTLSGTTAANSTMTITTTARAIAAAVPRSGGLSAGLLSGLMAAMGVVLAGSSRKRRRWHPLCLMLVLAAIVGGMVACGGGGSSTPAPSPGTPAGTYSIVVTATSGSTSHQSSISLTVR